MKDAKAYLSEIRTLRRRAETMGERLRELRAQATLLSGIDYSKAVVQTSPGDMMADIMGEVEELTRRYRDAILDYQTVTEERATQIYRLGRPLYEEILERRYLRDQTLDLIADKMGLSYERVKHLHGEALAEFGRRFLQVDTK